MASGISEKVESSDSVFVISRARLPWLLIGLLGGIFGAYVIGFFEGEIKEHAVMASFIFRDDSRTISLYAGITKLITKKYLKRRIISLVYNVSILWTWE